MEPQKNERKTGGGVRTQARPYVQFPVLQIKEVGKSPCFSSTINKGNTEESVFLLFYIK